MRGGGVALLLALTFISCEQSNQKTNDLKSGKGNLTRQDANLYLEQISKQIAGNIGTSQMSKQSVSAGIAQSAFMSKISQKGHVKINDVIADTDPIITIDGEQHELRLEVFNPNTVEKMSKSVAITSGDIYGVYADPINYYDGQSDHVDFPVQIVSLQNGIYSSREEIWTAPYSADIDAIDEAFNTYIKQLRQNTPFPLYAVTAENAEEDPFDVGMNKRAYAGPYLGFEGVYLKVERDGLTDEEFELWWTEPEFSGLIHRRDMFNGHHHTDESGTNVYFPDVNHEGNWEQLGDEFNTPIRLISLADGGIKALTPWEDDATAGSMKRFGRPFPTQYNPVIDGVETGAWAQIKTYDDAFNCESNYVDDNVPLHYYVDGFADADEDDPYSEGAVYRISAQSILSRAQAGRFETNQAVNHKLDDINYRFNYYAN